MLAGTMYIGIFMVMITVLEPYKVLFGMVMIAKTKVVILVQMIVANWLDDFVLLQAIL